MPNYDDTPYTQSTTTSPPQPRPRHRRFDRSGDRYPGDDSLEEVCVERRQFSRRDGQYSPKGHLTVRHDEMVRRPGYSQSRSADPPRRRREFRSDEDSGSSEESDSEVEYRRSTAVARRRSDRHLKVAPVGDQYVDYPRRSRSRTHTKDHHSDSDSSSDSSSSSTSSEEHEKKRKHRNRKLLYTGLAAVTTVAAANNIYQNTKAHHARREKLQKFEMGEAEAKKLKAKALLMDLATVGVVAVGINNARMGWKRVEAIGKEGR